MTARDFLPSSDFEKIRQAVAERERFEYKKEIASEGTEWALELSSGGVSERLAESVWSGNRYVLMADVNYKGKAGFGGWGQATIDYDLFMSWDRLKAQIDRWFAKADGYEAEELGQMCLF